MSKHDETAQTIAEKKGVDYKGKVQISRHLVKSLRWKQLTPLETLPVNCRDSEVRFMWQEQTMRQLRLLWITTATQRLALWILQEIS